MIGVRRQTQIYLDGVTGRRPRVPLDAGRLEALAQPRMRREAFAYVAAGTGNERTVAANRAAFDRWRIVPRMLRDVDHRDTSVELFGQRLPSSRRSPSVREPCSLGARTSTRSASPVAPAYANCS
jgi:lactate 2-monooxygenase